jgi:hypothetical protein
MCNLLLDLWTKIYEKLFGGFENLALTTVDDEEEEDELDPKPASKNKKGGYLKDKFVVYAESSSEHSASDSEDEFEDCSDGNGKNKQINK